MQIYDVVIIGSGPAGLTAGLYTTRAGLKTVILEREAFGGYLVNIDLVENYPGFAESIPGNELARNMMKQAMNYGVEFQLAEATGLEIEGDHKLVKTTQGNYVGKTIIVTSGSHPKKLGVPGEEEFVGRGVAYCAVCDGGSFANKKITVAGGGDAGITGGLYLTKIASRITIIELMPECSATKVLLKRAQDNPKIEIKCGTRIKSIVGEDQVKALKLVDEKTSQESILEVDGIFVYVGLEPNSDYLKDVLPLDSDGQILVNDKMETQVPGCFAAGDVRHNSDRQIITAAGDGAVAALSACRFLMARD